ncbi:hypothetical protein C8R45DRAFT_946393 [Mycena sanguinolenta]|nr:hypothetical protein C8R45DRAFT_946393 [Mycena sanguinolenta]
MSGHIQAYPGRNLALDQNLVSVLIWPNLSESARLCRTYAEKAVIFNLQPIRQVELYKEHVLHWLRNSRREGRAGKNAESYSVSPARASETRALEIEYSKHRYLPVDKQHSRISVLCSGRWLLKSGTISRCHADLSPFSKFQVRIERSQVTPPFELSEIVQYMRGQLLPFSWDTRACKRNEEVHETIKRTSLNTRRRAKTYRENHCPGTASSQSPARSEQTTALAEAFASELLQNGESRVIERGNGSEKKEKKNTKVLDDLRCFRGNRPIAVVMFKGYHMPNASSSPT